MEGIRWAIGIGVAAAVVRLTRSSLPGVDPARRAAAMDPLTACENRPEMAFDYLYGFAPYVTAAQRRRQAERELAKLAKASGRAPAPVVVKGRKIAATFWGKAWCENLEGYSDFATRLPRGRSYVRNGCVVDLWITPGAVEARVSGTELYTVDIAVAPVSSSQWETICRDVAGAIDSVIELLQGRLSTSVMARLCQKGTGLFPSPAEITLSCSCPDWARMCKHVAAVLYGVGARLDTDPALLFTLRRVNQEDLVARAGAAADLTKGRTKSRRVVDESVLGDVFGLDLARREDPRRAISSSRAQASPSRKANGKRPKTKTVMAKDARHGAAAPTTAGRQQRTRAPTGARRRRR
jgi:uncharacterized Zn finger protein